MSHQKLCILQFRLGDYWKGAEVKTVDKAGIKVPWIVHDMMSHVRIKLFEIRSDCNVLPVPNDLHHCASHLDRCNLVPVHKGYDQVCLVGLCLILLLLP